MLIVLNIAGFQMPVWFQSYIQIWYPVSRTPDSHWRSSGNNIFDIRYIEVGLKIYIERWGAVSTSMIISFEWVDGNI